LDTVSLEGSSMEATLSGTNDLTITNLVCEWSTLQGSGAVNIPAGGTVSNSSVSLRLDGRILNMAGTAGCAGLVGVNGAVVNNFGTWELQDNGSVSSLTFSNYGRLVKTGGSGTAIFSYAPLHNSGTVEVQSGMLELGTGGVNATGAFTVAAGAILDFVGGSYTLAPGARLDSAGTVRVSAYLYPGTLWHSGALFRTPRLEVPYGNAYLDTPVEVTTLIVNNGFVYFGTPTALDTVSLEGNNMEATLSGTNDLTITNLVGAWSALQGSGAVNIPADGSVSNSSISLRLDGRVLNMAGTARCASLIGANGAVVNNTGTWELRDNWGVSSLTFSNYGQLVKTGGSGTATFGFAPCYNSGTVEALSGTLLFNHSYRQAAGFTLLQGGNLGGPSLDIQGGLLGGAGTISGNLANNGLVTPGASPGRLVIEGNYTQTAGGALNIELDGLIAGAEFDQLQVSGTASLGGHLNVTLVNGFVPGTNDVFPFLTGAPRPSAFATFHADAVGGGYYLNPVYQPGGVELRVVEPTPRFVSSQLQRSSRQAWFQMAGVAAQNYVIEATTNSTSTHLTGWLPILTNTVPGSTLLKFTDPERTNYLYRFFRARFAP